MSGYLCFNSFLETPSHFHFLIGRRLTHSTFVSQNPKSSLLLYPALGRHALHQLSPQRGCKHTLVMNLPLSMSLTLSLRGFPLDRDNA
jgi:hypothetical protein